MSFLKQVLLEIKDGIGNAKFVATTDIGTTSTSVLVPASSPVDQFGGPLFAENNPGVIVDIKAALSAHFNRPNNLIGYASGQLVANDTVAGNVQAMQFPIARAMGASVAVQRGRLIKSGLTATNAIFRAHILALQPPIPSAGDGGALALTGVTTYMGSFTFDMTGANARTFFADGLVVNAVPDVGNEMVATLPNTSNSVYALLEARAAYNPAQNEQFTLSLEYSQK